MGSDRVRVSYDPSRHWQGVVYQQGRVTLEADWNEAETIAAEDNREQLIDIIGPSGTPDDGYRVIPVLDANNDASGDLTIQAGTLYVGGERMVLDTGLDYADQPDWVDTEGDPLWVAPAVPDGDADESVYLLMREQEVGAVEDPALLDVALGGPDTAGRRRIVQRIVRGAIDGNTCAVGLSTLEGYWEQHGLTFDPTTMRLDSSAALQVSFQQDPTAATPCDPVAQGGYLGAENQLIRVQIASVDATGPTLVWGFDNAYFLYRVTLGAVDEAAGTTVLTLANAPVDSYHQPQKGQTVEVLEAAAQLTATDYIAETTGIVTTVDTAYQPDTQELVIDAALGAPTTSSPLLFLRVWQDTIPSYGGGPVPLGTTGLQVTLALSSGVYHPGDFWVFAVRPGTPTTVSPVYPERILDAPQPPDGPRMWACPLGVVEWAGGVPTVIDCRQHFCQLVTACGDDGCCVDVSPETVDGGAGLQAVIDRYASKGSVTICLKPGTYTLPKPLVITKAQAGLTIKACGRGVVLQAAEDPPPIFLLGLILLDGVVDFTLCGIELELPQVPLKPTAAAVKTAIAALPSEQQPLLLAYVRALKLSIGVYVLAGRGITIEECTFTYASSNAELFGAAVFAARAVVGLKLLDNTFTAPVQDTLPFASLAKRKEAEGAVQLLVGYLQLPTRTQAVSFDVLGGSAVAGEVAASRSSARLTAEAAATAAAAAVQIGLPALADGVIERNLFQGLTVPVLVLGRLGTVRVQENTVRACYGGFWLIHTANAAAVTLLDRAGSATDAAWEHIAPSGLAALGDPVFLLATVLARILPVTPDKTAPAGSIGMLTAPSKTILADAEKVFRNLYTTASQAAPTPEPAPAPAPSAAGDVAYPTELANMFVSAASAGRLGRAAAADPGTTLEPRLEITANQVDAVIAESDSGAGLIVLSLDATHPSSLVCSDNRFRSRVASGATVSLWELLECAITGNIVSNESGGDLDRSMVLVPRIPGKVAAVAVTGNVLIGPAILPTRQNLLPPFDTWDGLNTVMTVLS